MLVQNSKLFEAIHFIILRHCENDVIISPNLNSDNDKIKIEEYEKFTT